jgi:AcrR family transcriptional regulator
MDVRGNRLSALDWLDAALEIFERDGVEAVRIEPLARKLNVSRGSFYWHFRDRAALLRDLLARWEVRETARIIEIVEAGGGSAAVRLLRLLETCARDEGRLEMALRNWANSDAQARNAVAQVDLRRTQYLAALLVEHGLEPEQAEKRSRVAYAAWLGEYTRPQTSSVAERMADMRCLHGLVLTPPGPSRT